MEEDASLELIEIEFLAGVCSLSFGAGLPKFDAAGADTPELLLCLFEFSVFFAFNTSLVVSAGSECTEVLLGQ